MSRHNFKPILGALNKDVYVLDGYVGINADASVGTSSIDGVSVAKTGTGQYTFSMVEDDGTTPAYAGAVLFAECSVASTAAVSLVPQVQSYSTTAVVFNLNAAGTPTNPSAACGLLFFALCKRTNLSK